MSPVNRESEQSFFCCMSPIRGKLVFFKVHLFLKRYDTLISYFDWHQLHNDDFIYLKNSLCEYTLNNHFVKGQQTAIFGYTGPNRSRAITGNLKTLPICIRVLTDMESRQSQVELEALSIVYGYKRFSLYLVGCPKIYIYIDCSILAQCLTTLP